MRVAYLIMTHQNPRLLQRVIRTLSCGDKECAFFIHVDLKADFAAFSSVGGQNVRFSANRIPVHWGEYSQVKAILSLVRQAINDPSEYDYFVLITGACYPLRSGRYIRQFFEANQSMEFMDIVKVPGPGKPLSRFDTVRYPSNKPLRRFVFRVLAKIGLARRDHRRFLRGLEPYSGDGAWALTREACQFLLNSISANPHLEKFFQNTFAPDESFFQTILGNSKFHSRMRRNLVYAVWPGPVNGHPAWINHEDVTLFENQDQVSRQDSYGPGELLFARKFNDSQLDLVNRVDSMIERKEGVKLSALPGNHDETVGSPKGELSEPIGEQPLQAK